MSRYSSSYKAREPGRIGNVRKDGFAAASSQHESVTTKRKSESFVCIAGEREGDTKESRQSAPEQKKPRFSFGGGGNAAMSFDELMKQAKQNSNVDAVAQKHVAILRQQQPMPSISRSNPPKPVKSSSSRVPSRVPSNEISHQPMPAPKANPPKKEMSALALAAMKREVPRRSDLPSSSRPPLNKPRSAVPFREPKLPPPMSRANGPAYGSGTARSQPREPSREQNRSAVSSSKYASSSQLKTSSSSSTKYGSSSLSSSSKNGSSSSQNDASSKYGSSKRDLSSRPSQKPSRDNPYALQDRLILGDSKSKKTAERPKPLPPTPNSHSNPALMRKQPTILPGDLRYQGPPATVAKKPKPVEQKPKLGAWAKIGGESSRSSGDNNDRITHEIFGEMVRVRTPKAPEPKRPPPIPVPQRQPQNQSMVRSMSRSVPNEMAERRRLAAASRMRVGGSGGPSAEFRRRSEQYPGSSAARHRPLPYSGHHSRSSYGSYVSGHDDLTGDEYEEDNYNDDDEYDSDMADFIDDTEVDDLAREDFEESLRLINPHYNKAKWKMREAQIDERRMDARYRDIEAEDRRATRIALMEDVIEARKGSKGLA